MTVGYIVTLILLAIINFPFVIAVDWYVRRPNTKFVYKVEPEPGQVSREKRSAVITTPVHALLLGGFFLSGWLVPAPETLPTIASTFLIVFFWTEIWHYVSHIAMHTKPLHFIHREHHKSMLTNPWTSVSFSFLEKFIFSAGIIGFVAILSHWMPISFYGIAAYYVLYFYTNTLGHANFEFRKPHYYESWLGKLFNSPSFHAMHHARYTKNYGLLTPWLDILFGTAWEDFSQVQTRAAESKPLTRLREKATPI